MHPPIFIYGSPVRASLFAFILWNYITPEYMEHSVGYRVEKPGIRAVRLFHGKYRDRAVPYGKVIRQYQEKPHRICRRQDEHSPGARPSWCAALVGIRRTSARVSCPGD